MMQDPMTGRRLPVAHDPTGPVPFPPGDHAPDEDESACPVCDLVDVADAHPCAFEAGCSCWYGTPCGVPHCDHCGRAEDVPDDWNGETGCHRSCEAQAAARLEHCRLCGGPSTLCGQEWHNLERAHVACLEQSTTRLCAVFGCPRLAAAGDGRLCDECRPLYPGGYPDAR